MDAQKRGAIVASLLLVAVLALAFVGYGLLSNRRERETESSSTVAAQSVDSTNQQEVEPLLSDYDATVYTREGEPVRLSAIADGRPLVINFWATWCPYCLKEMPDYQQLVAEYGDEVSFAFVDQNDGKRETISVAEAWLEENGYTDLPVFYDTDLEASYSFGAQALPTTVLVSADGTIVSASAGAINLEAMRAALDELV